jgi:hypothetical protein
MASREVNINSKRTKYNAGPTTGSPPLSLSSIAHCYTSKTNIAPPAIIVHLFSLLILFHSRIVLRKEIILLFKFFELWN